jgi:hypothetical protein
MQNINAIKKTKLYRTLTGGIFFITLPQLVLIIVVAGLLVLMVSAAVKNNRGPLSTTALKRHLLLLRSKLERSNLINPDIEREEIEKLQNKIKTSSSSATISGNNDLKALVSDNCLAVQLILQQPHLDNRSGWIKLNALLTGFRASYFQV